MESKAKTIMIFFRHFFELLGCWPHFVDFCRFSSILDPTGREKQPKFDEFWQKKTPQISFKKTFHERWKKDLPHHQPRHQVLTTRFSPPDPHHQVLTTSATPPASHQPSSPTLPIQWAGGGPGSAGSIRRAPERARRVRRVAV